MKGGGVSGNVGLSSAPRAGICADVTSRTPRAWRSLSEGFWRLWAESSSFAGSSGDRVARPKSQTAWEIKEDRRRFLKD